MTGFEEQHEARERAKHDRAVDHRLDAHSKSIEILAECVENLTKVNDRLARRLKDLEDGPAAM